MWLQLPLKLRKAGRVWCGGARETREPRVTIALLLSKWSNLSNLPAFLDLNGIISNFHILNFKRRGQNSRNRHRTWQCWLWKVKINLSKNFWTKFYSSWYLDYVKICKLGGMVMRRINFDSFFKWKNKLVTLRTRSWWICLYRKKVAA